MMAQNKYKNHQKKLYELFDDTVLRTPEQEEPNNEAMEVDEDLFVSTEDPEREREILSINSVKKRSGEILFC